MGGVAGAAAISGLLFLLLSRRRRRHRLKDELQQHDLKPSSRPFISEVCLKHTILLVHVAVNPLRLGVNGCTEIRLGLCRTSLQEEEAENGRGPASSQSNMNSMVAAPPPYSPFSVAPLLTAFRCDQPPCPTFIQQLTEMCRPVPAVPVAICSTSRSSRTPASPTPATSHPSLPSSADRRPSRFPSMMPSGSGSVLLRWCSGLRTGSLELPPTPVAETELTVVAAGGAPVMDQIAEEGDAGSGSGSHPLRPGKSLQRPD